MHANEKDFYPLSGVTTYKINLRYTLGCCQADEIPYKIETRTDIKIRNKRPNCPFENYADPNTCTFRDIERLSVDANDEASFIYVSTTNLVLSHNSMN